MRPLPPSAITIVDGGISTTAEVLAPKLAISPEALKAELREGIVCSVAETGVNEDAGRTRLTFGYRTRAWTVVVEADDRLVESIAPAATGERRSSLVNFVRPAS